jgi:hypothetical protein
LPSWTEISDDPTLVALTGSAAGGAEGARAETDGSNGDSRSIDDSRVQTGAKAALSIACRASSPCRSFDTGCGDGTSRTGAAVWITSIAAGSSITR